MTYLPDGRTIVAGCEDGRILTWTIDKRRGWFIKPERVLQAHAGCVKWVIPAPDGNRIVSIGIDGAIRLWDIRSGICLGSYQARDLVVFASRITPQGQFVYGTQVGEVIPLSFHNLDLEPPLVTSFRMWLFGMDQTHGEWDKSIRAVCPWCGKLFKVPEGILGNIKNASWRLAQGDDPALLSECPGCRQPLKFNPFIVDNKRLYYS
jgi:WD40 repeat protein